MHHSDNLVQVHTIGVYCSLSAQPAYASRHVLYVISLYQFHGGMKALPAPSSPLPPEINLACVCMHVCMHTEGMRESVLRCVRQ